MGPTMRRYIHKTNVSNQRNGFLIWKKGVLKQIESDNNIHSLRSMARIVYRVYQRRQILDPMQHFFTTWYTFTHSTWPRVVRRTLHRLNRSFATNVSLAIEKWRQYVTNIKMHDYYILKTKKKIEIEKRKIVETTLLNARQ